MYNSVIAGYSRSPFTMANKVELIDVKPVNLLADVIKNLVSKSKINPEYVTQELIDIWRLNLKIKRQIGITPEFKGED